MTISELIRALNDIRAEHGEVQCEDAYGQSIGEPEFIEGVVVVADKA